MIKFTDRRRPHWWQRMQRHWQDYQWFLIAAFWLIALALGYVGFKKYFEALGETRSPWDILYLSLQLFVLESGSISGPLSWELEVARLLAPGIAVYTAIQALFLLFYEELQLLRLKFVKDHVVICGLGRKGLLLTREFRELGHKVVVIEKDEDNDMLEQCKRKGAMSLLGDATDRDLLCKARVHKAKYLISVCGDDGANAEVAVIARDLTGKRTGQVLTCLVHIVEPNLCNLLKEQEIRFGKADSFRLEFFNVFERGARMLLEEYPAFDEKSYAQKRLPHLLVIGLGRMGESLVVHAARSWQYNYKASGKQLPITIIDWKAEQKIKSLYLQYPQLKKICQLLPQQMDVNSAEFRRGEFLYDSDGQSSVTTVYVCFDDDSRGLSTALTLFQQLRGKNIPIVVRTALATGLATLLKGDDKEGGGFANLHAFGLLDKTCKPDLIVGGTWGVLARAIHEDYVRQQREAGQTPETNPSMVPWDELPEDLKESNQRQADHIGEKLKAVGCEIVPLTDWDAKLFEFTAEEVELLAWMEHERWMAERIDKGWKYAPGSKDIQRKTNPCLVPWENLPEEEKEKDRNTVRNLPAFLARAGFQIYRVK